MADKKKLKSVTLSPELYDLLEKDHRAMERLRKIGAYYLLSNKNQNVVVGENEDIADAILAVDK